MFTGEVHLMCFLNQILSDLEVKRLYSIRLYFGDNGVRWESYILYFKANININTQRNFNVLNQYNKNVKGWRIIIRWSHKIVLEVYNKWIQWTFKIFNNIYLYELKQEKNDVTGGGDNQLWQKTVTSSKQTWAGTQWASHQAGIQCET